MSVEERLNAALGSAAVDFENKNYVAVLGFPGVGKTVLVTLLGNALDKHFQDKQSEIKGRITSGRDFIENWENGMLDGNFPTRTQVLARDEIVIEMSRPGSTGTATEIRFPDISGETFTNLCLGEEIPGPERVLKVLDMAKPKGKSHGDMGYVIYSNIYLILLDCSKMSEWEKLAIRHAQALATIKDFKDVIKKTKKGKIENPIGIILTKSDALNDPDEDAESVVNKNMKRFMNSLEALHVGEREFFKVHVDVERSIDNTVTDPTALKVRNPLTYNHDEYVRLLKWIHDNI